MRTRPRWRLRCGRCASGAAWLLASVVIAGCTQPTTRPSGPPPTQHTQEAHSPTRDPTRWQMVHEADLSPGQQAQRKRAMKARDALFTRLLTRLTEAMQPPTHEFERAGTPAIASAIRVCRGEAPGLAREVSQSHGLRIGRTSDRLRNPANTPPAWALPVVNARSTGPGYFLSSEGTLGVTLPIRLASACVRCHGPTATLAPDARAALAELYPSDASTGYQEGDLRGWFWIEVPAMTEPPTSAATD